MNKIPTPDEVLANPCVSFWVKDALNKALDRDCLDAQYDAELLATVLKQHADTLLGR